MPRARIRVLEMVLTWSIVPVNKLEISGTSGVVSRISRAQSRALKKCRNSFSDGSTPESPGDHQHSCGDPHLEMVTDVSEAPGERSLDREFLEHLDRLLGRYRRFKDQEVASAHPGGEDSTTESLDRSLLSKVISSLREQRERVVAVGAIEVVKMIESFNRS